MKGKDLPKICALCLGGVGSGRSNQPPFLPRPGPLWWMDVLLWPSQHRSGHLDIGHGFKSARPSPGLPPWCPPQPAATPIKRPSPTRPHLRPTKEPEIPGTGIALLASPAHGTPLQSQTLAQHHGGGWRGQERRLGMGW